MEDPEAEAGGGGVGGGDGVTDIGVLYSNGPQD